jgi:tetratricopeptide (TPR) repeat protein
MNMRKVISLFLTMVVASALVITDTGCTAKAKRAYHLQRANHYFDSAQYDKAELEYLNVWHGDQQNVQANSRLGLIYFDMGLIGQAAFFLHKGSQLATNDLNVQLKWGLICLVLGKTTDARNQANYILDRSPTNEEAPLLLAESVATTNEFNEARLHLQKLAQAGDRASIEVGLGTLSFRERDFKTAEADYKRALALDPKSAAAYEQLGGLYSFENNLPQADAALKAAFDLSPPGSPRRLEYAQFKIGTRDLDAGKSILKEMLKTIPDCLPALLELTKVSAVQKNYDDSAAYLSKVLARDPNNPQAMSMEAELKLTRGQIADAITELERMAKLYPKSPFSPSVYYQLALAYLSTNDIKIADAKTDLERNDIKNAISNLNQAVNLNTNFTEAILLLSQVQIINAVKKDDYTPVVTLLQRLIQQQPQIPQIPLAQLWLGDALRGQSNFDRALTVYQGLQNAYPTNSEILLRMGETYLKQQDYSEARRAFNRMLELEPDNTNATEYLVRLDLREKQFPAAMQRALLYAEKNPKLAEPQLLLAEAYHVQGDNQKTEDALLKAIEVQPESEDAYLFLAQLYFNSKQEDKAWAELKIVLAKDPKSTPALMLAGSIYMDENNYKAAANAYEQLLAMDAKSIIGLNNLAYLYSEKIGQLDRAGDLAQRARELVPNDPSTADTLGWVFYRKGQYTQALGLLQESANKLPAEPEVQFHWGMVNYMTGQEESARAALQSAVQLSKDFPGRDEGILCLSLLAIDPNTADDTARTTLEKRVSDKSDDPVALARLGAIYKLKGADGKAIATYETALKLNSQNATTLVNLAQLYSAKDVQKALGFARDAYKISPNNDQVASTLGRLAYATGNYKLAFNLLKKTAQNQPGSPALQYDYAKAAFNVGSVPESASAMQTALQIGLPSAQSAEGRRLLEMISLAANPDQAVAAISRIEEILKSDANYLPALMVMGVINEQKNDLAAAQQIYEKVLAPTLYPDFAPAQKRLAILYAKDPNNKEKASALALKARETYPDDSELAKTIAIIVFQQGDYPRAEKLLQSSASDRSTDPEPSYYLGLVYNHQKNTLRCKAALQHALDLNLSGTQLADAKRILAGLN